MSKPSCMNCKHRQNSRACLTYVRCPSREQSYSHKPFWEALVFWEDIAANCKHYEEPEEPGELRCKDCRHFRPAATETDFNCCDHIDYEALRRAAKLRYKAGPANVCRNYEEKDDQPCGKCIHRMITLKKGELDEVRCPIRGFIWNRESGFIWGQKKCSHYEERAELCGSISPCESFICDKKKGHLGPHDNHNWMRGGPKPRIIHHEWTDPTPTAFDKAWEEFVSPVTQSLTTKNCFRAGWQACQEAALKAINKVPVLACYDTSLENILKAAPTEGKTQVHLSQCAAIRAVTNLAEDIT